MPQPAVIAFDDQADAAEADLSRILERTAAGLLGNDTHSEQPAPWLTAKLDAFAAAVDTGAVQLCEHLADATAPRPAFGILGSPRLTCPACASRLGPDEDVRCDRCGRAAELMEPAIANLGTIALLILVCDPCTRDETRDETP